MRGCGFGLVKLSAVGLYGGCELIEFNSFSIHKTCYDSDEARLWRAVNNVGDQRRVISLGYWGT